MQTMSTFTVAHSEIAHERVEDEVIVINLRTGAYFSLVDVAADAWELLVASTALDEIATHVANRHGVDASTVLADLDRFVSSLLAEDLLVGIDPAQAPAAGAATSTTPGTRPYHPPMLEKYNDMEELLLLDPIHEVDEAGWPVVAAEPVDG